MEGRRLARKLALVPPLGRWSRKYGRRRMVLEGTSVGLDVPARSIVAGGWTASRGRCGRGGCRRPRGGPELGRVAARPGPGRLRGWSDRVRAGPGAAGGRVGCVVVAPSKLERPPGDRVKTDGATPNGWPGCCTLGSCPFCALVITDEASPLALRSTRNRPRTAMHRRCSGCSRGLPRRWRMCWWGRRLHTDPCQRFARNRAPPIDGKDGVAGPIPAGGARQVDDQQK
jgi:hypothetical protein